MHLKGRLVAPLRRTPKGILSLPNLHFYTKYLEWKKAGKPLDDPEFVSTCDALRPKLLTAGQYAFCNRLGVGGEALVDSVWSPCFYPTGFSIHDEQGQQLHELGRKALSFFTREFVESKWRHASPKLQGRLADLYNGQVGLSGMGKQHGLEQCIHNLLGIQMEPLPSSLADLGTTIRHLVFPRERLYLKFPDEQQKNQLISWSMTSVVGAMLKTTCPQQVRQFLDCRLFSAVCRTKDLFESEHPMMELVETLREADEEANVHFKLLAESGRLSNDSMYLVGVYDNKMDIKLGEGHGQSILVAQKRACMDALRRINLEEVFGSVVKRPSDTFTDTDYQQAFC